MAKWGKRLGIGVGVLVLLLLGLVGVVRGLSASRQSQTYDVAGATFDVPTDPASLAEGERLFVSRGCGSTDCHQADGAGSVLMHDGPLGDLAASNLTICAQGFDPPAWDRAIRHGLRSDHRSLIFMPSADYQYMDDHELSLIVGYIRSLPLVLSPQPPCAPSMLARTVDVAGGFALFPASQVDHAHVSDPDPPPGRTAEYGHYLAQLCTSCHGGHFSGGPIPGAPPEMGTPLNLTQHPTGLQAWTEEQFRTALRTGARPSGPPINPDQMPYEALARMTDDEIGAIWLYLREQPPMPEGSR